MRLTSPVILSALLLCGQTVTGVLVPALSAEAYAADFTGKIKRVRIKSRGKPYNSLPCWDCMVVVTTTEGAVPDGVRLSLESLDGGDISETVETSTPVDAAVLLSADLGMVLPEDSASVTLRLTPLDELGEEMYEPVDVTLAAGLAEFSEAEFSFDDGDGLVAIYGSSDTSVTVEVEMDFDRWPEVDLTTVAVEVLDASLEVIDDSGELEITAADTKWRLGTDTALSGQLQVHAELLDGEEVAVEAYAMRSITGDDAPAGVVSAKLAETKTEGRYAVSSWVAYTDGSDGGDVVLSVTTGEGEQIEEKAMKTKEVQEVWRTDGITFGDDPVGFTYALSFSLTDEEGDVHDFPFELVVPEPGALALTAYDGAIAEDNANLAYAAMFSDDDGETWSVVAYACCSAWSHVIITHELQFEEPFEGPEPDEIGIMNREVVWTRSRASFTSETDPTFLVSLSSSTELGEGEEEVSFWATAGVSGNGRGTKKAGYWRPSPPPPWGLQ